MNVYTLYDKGTLEIKSVISTNDENFTNLLSENDGYLIGKFDIDNTILVNNSGIITPVLKESIPVTITSLSCYSDLSYNSIASNIPSGTKIFINDDLLGESTETDNNLELSLDTPGIYILKFDNDLYNKSSQTFKLTAYEN